MAVNGRVVLWLVCRLLVVVRKRLLCCSLRSVLEPEFFLEFAADLFERNWLVSGTLFGLVCCSGESARPDLSRVRFSWQKAHSR